MHQSPWPALKGRDWVAKGRGHLHPNHMVQSGGGEEFQRQVGIVNRCELQMPTVLDDRQCTAQVRFPFPPHASSVTLAKHLIFPCFEVFTCKIEVVQYVPHGTILRLNEMNSVNSGLGMPCIQHIFIIFSLYFLMLPHM